VVIGAAQTKDPNRYDFAANCTKTEVEIPMRDGVKLFTSIITPKDESVRQPIILVRTPYSVAPYGPGAFPPMFGSLSQFGREGYIIVRQDVRGRNQSGGVW